MFDWTSQSMGRLYELYKLHVDNLARDVQATNSSLGSPHPGKTGLVCLSRSQFEAILIDPTSDQEAVQLWLRRIVRGYEGEFPALQAAG